MAFLIIKNMPRLVDVIEAFRVGENATANEAVDYVSDLLVQDRLVNVYDCTAGTAMLLEVGDDLERADAICGLYSSRYWELLDIGDDDTLDRTQAEAVTLRSTIKDIIEFAKRISVKTPKGAQAIIDYVRLNFDAETNTIKDVEGLKKKGRASFLSANNMARLVNVIEAFQVGETSKPNEAADHIVTVLLENEEVRIYQILGAIPELLDSCKRSDYLYEIFNSHYWDNSRNELSKYNDKLIFSLRSPNDDILMLADRMKAETPKGAAKIIESMKDPIFRNKDIRCSAKSEIEVIQKQNDFVISSDYSTDFIYILNLAVKEFFNPRKNVDPKKEEVTEWIKAKGKKLNIIVSDNVADTIFTIIKPNDHNPKIKRA